MICPFMAILKESQGQYQTRTGDENCKQSACAMWRTDEQGEGFCGLAGPLQRNQVEMTLKPSQPANNSPSPSRS